jgi:hypothetical protein
MKRLKINEIENAPKEISEKKPYEPPRLTVYGDLKRVTAGRGGSKIDGSSGRPKS